jgi:GntR family transcriptional repressor for pyruvate dehydrogenase complex
MSQVIQSFKEIEVEKPVDIIIKQIRDLISSGQLNPGDRLPSERQLSEKLGIGRTYVRDAIRKLEFYGILKVQPQSGTTVAGLGITALEGLITGVLKMEKSDFSSLVETRVILEVEATKLAAIRRTTEDVDNLLINLDLFHDQVKKGNSGVEEDFMFHLKISESSKNLVIKSLMMIVVPEILQIYKNLRICEDGKLYKSYEDHLNVFNAIKNKKPDDAAAAMKFHLKDILEYSKTDFNL